MSVYSYGNPAGRINKLKGEILSHSIPVETLGITGMIAHGETMIL